MGVARQFTVHQISKSRSDNPPAPNPGNPPPAISVPMEIETQENGTGSDPRGAPKKKKKKKKKKEKKATYLPTYLFLRSFFRPSGLVLENICSKFVWCFWAPRAEKRPKTR
jgi:hypothetical protein